MRASQFDRLRPDTRRRAVAVRPIGYNDMCFAADAVADVAPDWTVELSVAFPGGGSLVIMPEGADDLIGPTFIVYQDRNAFRLDQFQWDELSPLGEYANLRDAVIAVVTCLVHLTAPSASGSTLLH